MIAPALPCTASKFRKYSDQFGRSFQEHACLWKHENCWTRGIRHVRSTGSSSTAVNSYICNMPISSNFTNRKTAIETRYQSLPIDHLQSWTMNAQCHRHLGQLTWVQLLSSADEVCLRRNVPRFGSRDLFCQRRHVILISWQHPASEKEPVFALRLETGNWQSNPYMYMLNHMLNDIWYENIYYNILYDMQIIYIYIYLYA